MADWYYIGHYGQLGPLTREQIDELVQGGVIGRDTYVWCSGMPDWLPAEKVSDLRQGFQLAEPFAAPPPPPGMPRVAPAPPMVPSRPYGAGDAPLASNYNQPLYSYVRSDRSRTLAGILQLIFPGVGRIYLGYSAYGVLQLVLTLCMGLGYLWSFIDGIVILSGGVKLDGYGRQLNE